MRDAQSYPITFGYGAKTTINGKSYIHRGQDRRCPIGTPLIIGGITIATTGNTGLSTGPHVHLQAGTDPATQNTINPSAYWFRPGTVTNLRNRDEKDWGKFITIKTDGVYTTYAHLNSVNVKVGQVIRATNPKPPQGEDMIDLGIARVLAYHILGRNKAPNNALAGQVDGDLNKHHVGKPTNAKVWEFYNSTEGKNWREKTLPALTAKASERDAYAKKVSDLEKALQNEKNKPPKEVIKEVEKIVKVPVEVPVERFPSWVPGWIKSILERLFKKG